MPIRFACPHCHQRLSVSTRKAGTAATCPRCQAEVAIPLAGDDAAALPASDSDPLAGSFLVGEPMKPESETEIAIEPPPRTGEAQNPELGIVPNTHAAVSPPIARAPLHNLPSPNSQPVARDSIVVQRYVIYAQGGLLAAVALASLLIGILLGQSFAPRPANHDAPRECTVSGGVTYTTGVRTRPDRGAVVVLIPVTADAAGERAPVVGLRPSDPPPLTDHPGLGVIRQLGGAYTRADANGRFETRVPTGRYWLLIISHQKRASSAAIAGDVRTLGRYFENAADVFEDRAYRLTQETIDGDVQWAINFKE